MTGEAAGGQNDILRIDVRLDIIVIVLGAFLFGAIMGLCLGKANK